MKKLIAFLSVLTLLSCSSERKAQYHYQKALKYGLKLITDSDTIRVVSVDSFPVIKNDTIYWETKIEYKYKTQIIKQDVLKYKYIYKDSKEKRKEVQQEKRKTNWSLFFWGFLIGFVSFFVLRIVIKLSRPI